VCDEVLSLLTLPLSTLEKWKVFDARVTELVNAGFLRRIEPLKLIYARSEEWYVDTGSGETYVYLKPDDRVPPRWEKIDPFAPPPEPGPSRDLRRVGLKIIELGEIDRNRAMFLHSMLQVFAKESRIELLERQTSSEYETWCREYRTDVVYKLTCNDHERVYRWDRMGFGSVEEDISLPN